MEYESQYEKKEKFEEPQQTEKDRLRKEIELQTKRYLARGGKIETVPTDFPAKHVSQLCQRKKDKILADIKEEGERKRKNPGTKFPDEGGRK